MIRREIQRIGGKGRREFNGEISGEYVFVFFDLFFDTIQVREPYLSAFFLEKTETNKFWESCREELGIPATTSPTDLEEIENGSVCGLRSYFQCFLTGEKK
jgi:hypothetical protein